MREDVDYLGDPSGHIVYTCIIASQSDRIFRQSMNVAPHVFAIINMISRARKEGMAFSAAATSDARKQPSEMSMGLSYPNISHQERPQLLQLTQHCLAACRLLV